MKQFGTQEGVCWQHSDNARLRRLAFQRAEETHPELEDVERQHDGSIQVNFGSYVEEIRLRDTSGGAAMLFLNGFCSLLAYALHERLGLPFGIITDTKSTMFGWSGHAGLMISDELFLDVRGVRSLTEVVEEFRFQDYSFEVVGKDEFLAQLVDAQLHHNPMLFLEELEQLITEDFADYLIQTEKLSSVVAV